MHKDFAKVVFVILASDEALRRRAIAELVGRLGGVDFDGPLHPFDCTDYYTSEMGGGLKRSFVALKELKRPYDLSNLKEIAASVEDMFRVNDKRQVNIDPGYIDHFKFVLFSGKHGGHKIAILQGTYADMLLRYEKNKWHPFPWTFPDFKNGTYDKDLTEVRNIYKKQVTHDS
jgi:hypothetical protein